MPYNPALVAPMRAEVTRLGAKELTTAADVDAALGDQKGSMLVFVNSVCGCAAGNARPALALALEHPVVPQQVVTVFAGQDLDAVWDAEWKKNLLHQALEGVKKQVAPKQFQIFDLYVLQETPIEAITRALGVSAGQVYLAKHRVSQVLKDELKKVERRLECDL